MLLGDLKPALGCWAFLAQDWDSVHITLHLTLLSVLYWTQKKKKIVRDSVSIMSASDLLDFLSQMFFDFLSVYMHALANTLSTVTHTSASSLDYVMIHVRRDGWDSFNLIFFCVAPMTLSELIKPWPVSQSHSLTGCSLPPNPQPSGGSFCCLGGACDWSALVCHSTAQQDLTG